ncbi:hypothetical protein Nepgr_003929 [Nepenthes gracilis]|uniref:Uncharacterized protein n=1 Tax=Nepenthes gracilis TaxID=150966 RepID=A0AAD3S0G1_NEPGR|nr:hypothetical protein Nepgr_003929 [Nepenthes gracilis]
MGFCFVAPHPMQLIGCCWWSVPVDFMIAAGVVVLGDALDCGSICALRLLDVDHPLDKSPFSPCCYDLDWILLFIWFKLRQLVADSAKGPRELLYQKKILPRDLLPSVYSSLLGCKSDAGAAIDDAGRLDHVAGDSMSVLSELWLWIQLGGCKPSADGSRWHLYGFELLSDFGLVFGLLQFSCCMPVHVGLILVKLGGLLK